MLGGGLSGALAYPQIILAFHLAFVQIGALLEEEESLVFSIDLLLLQTLLMSGSTVVFSRPRPRVPALLIKGGGASAAIRFCCLLVTSPAMCVLIYLIRV